MRLPAVLAGLPDRIAVVNGQFVALEIKVSEKSPRSKLQAYTLQKMVDAGAYARFVYPENWDEVQAHLQEFVWHRR